jgi:hypothetical protein
MLKLLLAEQITSKVASGLRRCCPGLAVYEMAEWEGGNFIGQPDAACLREAARQRLTLVTYDRLTIPLLLKTWADEGRRHGGVVFVDEKTIPQEKASELPRAMAMLAKETAAWEWRDRVYFLR